MGEFKIKLNGARILIEELINHKATTVFGYPGGAVLNIYDELYINSDRIKHVLTAHEQGAVHAADGYARANGDVGVCIATSGPGATNLVTGIANAYLDSVPLVAITGNVAVPLLGKDSFQEVDISGITLPITKHSFVVRDIKDLQSTIKSAFELARSGRKGPVLVDITKDVQMAEIEYIQTPPNDIILEDKSDINLEKSIEMIKNSKKPFIYCGGGVLASWASDEVMELSKKIDAPIGLSMMGLTSIPEEFELNLGLCGMHGNYSSTKAQSECDLLLAIGVRFSDRATGNVSEYRRKCNVIHIDIDAAEINKNIPSDIGLCGDIKTILNILNKKLDENKKPNWIDECNKFKIDDLPHDDLSLFTPQNIIETVNKNFSNDTIVATDVGQHQMWTIQHYDFQLPRTLLTSGGLGTMGYGMGAAIGGCLANNSKYTVLFTSDGSFGMNLNEMATAVTEKLPLVIILLNNGVLGMVRQWQRAFYDERFSNTTLDRKTDFVKLAQAFGADGYRTDDLTELNDILKNKLQIDKPCLIECIIDSDLKVLPMIPPGSSIDKIIMK